MNDIVRDIYKNLLCKIILINIYIKVYENL